MRIILITLLSIFCTYCTAGNLDTILTKEQMHEDIDAYISFVEEVHPNLYSKYSKEQFAELQSEIKNACNEPMTVALFFFQISKFNKYIEGHTQVYAPSGLYKYSATKPAWINFSDDGAYWGTHRIEKINDIPMSELISELEHLISFEINPTSKVRKMNALMEIVLERVHNIEQPYNYSLYDKESNTYIDSIIPSISNIAWSQKNNPSYSYTFHPDRFNRVFLPGDSIAILYYNSSQISDILDLKDIDRVCTEFFDILQEKDIKHLFIDVSQNGGGSDLVHDYIFKYIKHDGAKQKSTSYASQGGLDMLISSTNETIKLLDINDESQSEMHSGMKSHLNRLNKIARNGGKASRTTKIDKIKKGYEGKVYIIMGSNTYSSGESFCYHSKLLKLGPIVGEAIGQYSPYAASSFEENLPNSKMKYRSSTLYNVRNPSFTGDGGFMQPDIAYPLDHPLDQEDFRRIIELSKKN